MNLDDLMALISQHGGEVGRQALNPTVAGVGGITKPNPNPNVRITLRDGTSVVVNRQQDEGGNDATDDNGQQMYGILAMPKAPSANTRAARPAGKYADVRTNGAGRLVGILPDGTEEIIDATGKPSAQGTPNPFPGGHTKNAQGQIIGINADGSETVIDPSTTAARGGSGGSVRTPAQNDVDVSRAALNYAQAALDGDKQSLTQAQADLAQARTALVTAQTPEQIALLQQRIVESQAKVDETNARMQVDQANVQKIQAQTGLAVADTGKANAQGVQAEAAAQKSLTLTPNTTAAFIPKYNLSSGQIDWVPNQNQAMTSGDALASLYAELRPLAGKEIPLEEATQLLNAAHDRLQEDTLRYGHNTQLAGTVATAGTNAAQRMAETSTSPGVGSAIAKGYSSILGVDVPSGNTYDFGAMARHIAMQSLADTSPSAAAAQQQAGLQTPMAMNPDGTPMFTPPGAPTHPSVYQQMADQFNAAHGLVSPPPGSPPNTALAYPLARAMHENNSGGQFRWNDAPPPAPGTLTQVTPGTFSGGSSGFGPQPSGIQMATDPGFSQPASRMASMGPNTAQLAAAPTVSPMPFVAPYVAPPAPPAIPDETFQ